MTGLKPARDAVEMESVLYDDELNTPQTPLFPPVRLTLQIPHATVHPGSNQH